MQVDGTDFQVLAGEFPVHGRLRQVPGTMNVVGAKVQDNTLSSVSARFHTIGGLFATHFVASGKS